VAAPYDLKGGMRSIAGAVAELKVGLFPRINDAVEIASDMELIHHPDRRNGHDFGRQYFFSARSI